jgi:hypothetical protein
VRTLQERAERPDRWPMQGRYARARDRMGVVFGGDMQGCKVSKRDTGQGGPIQAPTARSRCFGSPTIGG